MTYSLSRWLRKASVVLGACALMGAADMQPNVSGPTPYPGKGGEWPGEGVIRVFDWMKPTRETYWKQRQRKQGAWVLAGDSLLGNWKTSEQDLAPVPVANRAIGGDVSRGLLFRFQEDVLDLHPAGIVLLIGGNDLSALQNTGQTTRNIDRMLQAIGKQNATLPVILCTLPPRDSEKAPIKQSELDSLNAGIKKVAASHHNVVLIDLYPLFATADGKPKAELFTKDRLHIGPAGYEVLASTFKPKMASLKAGQP